MRKRKHIEPPLLITHKWQESINQYGRLKIAKCKTDSKWYSVTTIDKLVTCAKCKAKS